MTGLVPLRLPLPPLPRWRPVRQRLTAAALPDVPAAVRDALAPHRGAVRPGARVAVAVGSRGIDQIAPVVATVVGTLRDWGAEPFVVPAMGSHGGGTADGQRAVLAGLGVTEAAVGAPIMATMDTVPVGTVLDGFAVRTDRYAAGADAIVPINRIKPHTDFRGPVESGLAKMLAIGLGKRDGAAALHGYPLRRFGEIIRAAGGLLCARLPVPFGLALLEDGYRRLSVVAAVAGTAIPDREPALLDCARELLPHLPVPELDVLLVGRVGKDVSGAGMDPNVTGRFAVPGITGPTTVRRLVALDLTDATHGNAAGLGTADVTTARLVDRLDTTAWYVNHMTTHWLGGARLPLVAATANDALAAAVTSLPPTDPAALRIGWIRDTATLGEFWLSEAALGPAVTPTGPPVPVDLAAGPGTG